MLIAVTRISFDTADSFIIYSDSRIALQALGSLYPCNSLVLKIQRFVTSIPTTGLSPSAGSPQPAFASIRRACAELFQRRRHIGSSFRTNFCVFSLCLDFFLFLFSLFNLLFLSVFFIYLFIYFILFSYLCRQRSFLLSGVVGLPAVSMDKPGPKSHAPSLSVFGASSVIPLPSRVLPTPLLRIFLICRTSSLVRMT